MDYNSFKCLYSGKFGKIYDPNVKGLIVCEYWGVWKVDDEDCLKDFKAGVDLIIKSLSISFQSCNLEPVKSVYRQIKQIIVQ